MPIWIAPLVLGALSLWVALHAAAAPTDGPVAALFPPWWGMSDTVLAASGAGQVVRAGALPFIAVVAQADRPALRRAGAWLLLDPLALAGCLQGADRTQHGF